MGIVRQSWCRNIRSALRTFSSSRPGHPPNLSPASSLPDADATAAVFDCRWPSSPPPSRLRLLRTPSLPPTASVCPAAEFGIRFSERRSFLSLSLSLSLSRRLSERSLSQWVGTELTVNDTGPFVSGPVPLARRSGRRPSAHHARLLALLGPRFSQCCNFEREPPRSRREAERRRCRWSRGKE